jgi:hypothetical protein
MAIDFDKLQESPHLLDILVQMEDVLDSFDIYVFENWIKGEIVEGPKVRRYWFDFTLRYPIKQMPDPKGAMRLLKHGVRVNYEKATLEDPEQAEKSDTPEDEVVEGAGEDEAKKEPKATHWEVKISIPRRLLSDMNSAELDMYDDEVEIEDVADAQDGGMNDETGYTDEEGAPTEAGPEGEENAPEEEEEEPDAPF